MSVRQIVKDLGWNKILKEHNIKSIEIKTGLFGDGKDPKNNMAYLGVIQHEGANIKITPKMRGFLHNIGIHVRNDTLYIIIPRRPFMSNTFDKYEKQIVNFILDEYRKVVDDKQTFKKMIDRIGVRHEGQIKKSFTEFTYKENHPVTIARKGSSKPLIDSGSMKNSIKYKVIYK